MILEILIVTLVTVIVGYLMKRRGTLESLGIPIIKPFLIFGSPPFLYHKMHTHKFISETHKKLGKTWGMYNGTQPIVFTIDPELLKLVLIKNFEDFSAVIDWDLSDDKLTLDLSSGEKWKALRKALSPTFTSGKLKSMLEPMDKIVDNLIKHLDKAVKNNTEIEMKGIFQSFSLDTISACAFGIEINSFENQTNEILENGKKLFTSFQCRTVMDDFVAWILNHFAFLLTTFGFYGEPYFKLYAITKNILNERQKLNIEKGDFLGRLHEMIKNTDDTLSPEIIIAQGVIFFAAGFETTSSTLSTLCYNLAKHPEIQEKIYEEVLEVIEESGGRIDSDTINNMHYLEAAINENLRLYSPITDHLRICVNDCEINGMHFKKGTSVQMPIFAAHYNEEFFPEPEKFIPERFLKENAANIQPFTFRPFGGGNRVCIGQRFAMNEMKICMARLLTKFKFVHTPETNLEFERGNFFFLLFNEVKVKLVSRDSES